eukprot:scaffold2518_cov178-Amphora_coffeaeformis.AAC.8
MQRILLRLVWISVLVLLALKGKVRSESTTTRGAAGEDIRSDSLLLLCTADGSIFVLNAWTGKLRSKSRTGFPLLTRSVSENHDHGGEGDDTVILANHIVPGLDGKLYWQEHNVEEQEDDDDDQEEFPLQPLPLSISSLLAHPVRTCSENQKACGILHAAEHTVLYGLDPQSGTLQWSTRGFFGMNHGNEDDDDTSDVSYLILQRKDVSIQQISSRNGRQLWNITMGSYQAVDFDGDSTGSASGGASSLLDDDDDLDNNDPGQVVSQLPSLAFLQGGRQLVAITRDMNGLSESFGPIIWRIEAPSRVASIFGILGGRWHPINILDGFYEHYDAPMHLPLLLSDAPFTPNAKSEWLDAWMKEEVYRLHHEQFAKQHDRFYPNVQGLLPAPDSVVKLVEGPEYPFQLPTIPITMVSPDGLVLSWDFVRGMIFFVTFLLVLIVSVIKRQKLLLRRAQLRVNLVESARRNPPKESQSLPGSSNKGSVSKAIQSDPGEITVVASKPEVGALVKISGGTTSAEESIQQGVIQQGGIPLVRYARFRSEFEQMQALGKGGFGSVFRCRNNLDGREYAIKKVCIRRKSENDTTFNQRLQRVLREVKILAVLDHPNIVRYYTAWLEVENGLDEDTEDPEDGASHFSSSYLTNQTTTEWGKGRTVNGISRSQWSADNDSQSSDTFLPRVPLHRSPVSGEDLGFIFEESNEDEWGSEMPPTNHSVAREIEPSESNSVTNEDIRVPDNPLSRNVPPAPAAGISAGNDKVLSLRHTLYIQMQLCSFDNLSDFVADPNARKGSMAKGIDVSLALRLFLQIVQAVQYCHEKGLIHRDLKPTNCFVDETGRIKVGDFGLSRESSDKDGEAVIELTHDAEDDQTAGVGTRLYASPEQSAGSMYDSSTDVFSLGIILFELCYPMYTGMERNICISRLRDNHEFPPDWETFVSKAFPTLRDLILKMLSKNPEDRPKASAVAEHVQEVLGELTIISVGTGKDTADDLVLLRVEANSEPDTLANTMEQIRQAALPESIDILQYGLSQTKHSHTIMEFALRSSPGLEAAVLVSRLKGRPRILTAREVSVSR